MRLLEVERSCLRVSWVTAGRVCSGDALIALLLPPVKTPLSSQARCPRFGLCLTLILPPLSILLAKGAKYQHKVLKHPFYKSKSKLFSTIKRVY